MVKIFLAFLGVLYAAGVAAAGIPLADFPGDLPGEVGLVERHSVRMSIPGRYVPRAGDKFVVVREDAQRRVRIIARGQLTIVEGCMVQGDFIEGEGSEVRAKDRVVVRTSLPPGVISKYGFLSMPVGSADVNEDLKPAAGGTDPSLAAVLDDKARSAAANQSERLYREALRLGASGEEALLRQAAGMNHSEAALALSRRLSKSSAVEEAKLWLRRAAELGSVEAQFLLGDSWAGSGLPGFEKRMDKALLWYDKAGETDPRGRELRKRALGYINPD